MKILNASRTGGIVYFFSSRVTSQVKPPGIRTSSTWILNQRSSSTPFIRWLNLWPALGIPDPTEATVLAQKARDLKHKAATFKGANLDSSATIEGILAGTLSDAQLMKKAASEAKQQDDLSDGVRQTRTLLNTAAQQAQNRAVLAVRDNVDATLETLNEYYQKQISAKNPNPDDYRTFREAVSLLHGWITPGIGATAEEVILRRPDLQAEWLGAHSTSVKEISWLEDSSGARSYLYGPHEGAPMMTFEVIANHAKEWEPRIYSTEEIIQNSQLWTRFQ